MNVCEGRVERRREVERREVERRDEGGREVLHTELRSRGGEYSIY